MTTTGNMGYNPQANRFEPVNTDQQREWPSFRQGEEVHLRGVDFKVQTIGEQQIVLNPIRSSR